MARAPDKSPPSPASAAPGLRPLGRNPLRLFALAVALPVFLLYVSSAIVAIYTLGTMAQDIDRVEDTRGISGMHAALDSFLNGLADAVSDEGTWNEAYLNVVVNADPAWMDTTWGATARLGQSYDNVLVTDQSGTIQFGENAVGAITGNISEHFSGARTMLRELDRGIAATGDATTVAHFSSDADGTVGLAAISIHQTSSTDLSVPSQTRRVLWIAQHFTPALLQNISLRYQLPLAALVSEVDPDSSSIDLTDVDGKVAGTVAWVPDRPGDAAFTRAVLVASAFFFGMGILLVLGLGVFRRAMLRRIAALEANWASHEAAPAAAPAAVVPGKLAFLDPDEVVEADNPIDGVSPMDFDIEYQPIFDLRAETLIGAEALLRWKKPDKTPLRQEELAPRDAAALLERAGILALRHAGGDIAPLLGLVLTVTVTPAQLISGVFAEKLAGTLGATSFPARRLQLAVNVAGLSDAEALRAPIASLRQMGMAIALSDFVLGPATAAYAQPGLADRIRLPRSLLAGIGSEPGKLALAEATMAVAKAAGFAVTAPAVEHKEEVAKLLRLGCREFQGQLFAPPMSIAALTQLILKPAAERKAS